jgi:uncharacterized protein YjbJ (UPF0337 family)
MREQVQGRLLRVVGALEQGWGWLTGDQSLYARGKRDRRLGRMWQAHCAVSSTTMVGHPGDGDG